MSTVYLISGANRGIGLGMVKALAKNPNTIIFAGARDASSKALVELSKEYPEVVFPISLISADLDNNREAAKIILDKAGKLDVVIANAGIARGGATLDRISLDEMNDHFKVNVLGPLALFQATESLLRQSTFSATPNDGKGKGGGKFVVVSSLAGSTAELQPIPVGVYSTSKAAVNHLTVKLQQENPDLVVFPICPGPVQTDMGYEAASVFGWNIEEMGMSVAVSVDKVLARINETGYQEGQKVLWSAMGKEVAW